MSDCRGQGSRRHQSIWRKWLLAGAIVIGVLAALVFMRPVLIAPVAGDDRILFPKLGAERSWTPLSEMAELPEWWEVRSDRGRVNVVSLFERRTAARMVIETSVRTGTPPYLLVGVLKVLLTVACVLTLAALVASLRWRRRDGALVRASGRTLLVCTVSGAILFAVGSQPQFVGPNGRNGWVSYPTHTYGAVISIFGVVALVLWLARLYAEGRYRILCVATLASLAVLTNFRYELVMTAVPLVVIALVLVPVTAGDRVAEGRRAKWVTGLAYAGVFLPLFAALRWYLREQCEAGTCYIGVTPSLSWDLFPTFGFNVVSSVPGVGYKQATRYVARSGTSTDGMYAPTVTSLFVAAGMAVALMVCWWLTRRRRVSASPADPNASEAVASGRDEALLLVVGAVICLLGALGAAAVMSLSEAAQAGTGLGRPYRHVVIGWAGMVWAVVLGVLALASWRPRVGAVAWTALAVTTAVVAAVQLPANERSLTANRIVNGASTAAFVAVMRGDLSTGANAHRCRLVRQMVKEPNYSGGGEAMVRAFDDAFLRYWGQEFCRR